MTPPWIEDAEAVYRHFLQRPSAPGLSRDDLQAVADKAGLCHGLTPREADRILHDLKPRRGQHCGFDDFCTVVRVIAGEANRKADPNAAAAARARLMRTRLETAPRRSRSRSCSPVSAASAPSLTTASAAYVPRDCVAVSVEVSAFIQRFGLDALAAALQLPRDCVSPFALVPAAPDAAAARDDDERIAATSRALWDAVQAAAPLVFPGSDPTAAAELCYQIVLAAVPTLVASLDR